MATTYELRAAPTAMFVVSSTAKTVVLSLWTYAKWAEPVATSCET